jgi:hypothetical protein
LPDSLTLCLDEDISGEKLLRLLRDAGIQVFLYESLGLERGKKIPDDTVIARARELGYVLLTADQSIEKESIDFICRYEARIIILTDTEGGLPNWAAAVICSHDACTRIFLNQPSGPVIIKVNRSGAITKFRGEEEIKKRRDQILTASIARAKRHASAKELKTA